MSNTTELRLRLFSLLQALTQLRVLHFWLRRQSIYLLNPTIVIFCRRSMRFMLHKFENSRLSWNLHLLHVFFPCIPPWLDILFNFGDQFTTQDHLRLSQRNLRPGEGKEFSLPFLIIGIFFAPILYQVIGKFIRYVTPWILSFSFTRSALIRVNSLSKLTHPTWVKSAVQMGLRFCRTCFQIQSNLDPVGLRSCRWSHLKKDLKWIVG